jgi:Creatinase/Prolidase N-terminal domain
MRRGLMSWSHQEVPPERLQARVAQVQAWMVEQGVSALLAHTSIAQPSVVHWLTHFTPYWSEAMMVVWPTGAPTLLASLTKRVHPWMREVGLMGELIMAPRLGEQTAQHLLASLAPDARVAMVGMPALPWSVAKPLLAHAPRLQWVDASDGFAALRRTSDASEKGLLTQANAMAHRALAAIPKGVADAATVTAAIEQHARLAGAEEVVQRIAPNLAQPSTWLRVDGEMPLASRYAVELSLAYKGTWVRAVRNLSAGDPPADWAQAEDWWQGQIKASALAVHAPAAPAVGELRHWRVELCQGGLPLSPVVDLPALSAGLPNGTSWGVVSAQLALPSGHWFAAQAVQWA